MTPAQCLVDTGVNIEALRLAISEERYQSLFGDDSVDVGVSPQAAAQLRGMASALIVIAREHEQFRKDFGEWLVDNWHVWQRFEREANAVHDSGRSHYSARTLVEFIRHETTIRENNSSFKINNSYVPDMGRLYGMLHAGREGFFECRVMGEGARERIRSRALTRASSAAKRQAEQMPEPMAA